jgi:hypothetical protein
MLEQGFDQKKLTVKKSNDTIGLQDIRKQFEQGLNHFFKKSWNIFLNAVVGCQYQKQKKMGVVLPVSIRCEMYPIK